MRKFTHELRNIHQCVNQTDFPYKSYLPVQIFTAVRRTNSRPARIQRSSCALKLGRSDRLRLVGSVSLNREDFGFRRETTTRFILFIYVFRMKKKTNGRQLSRDRCTSCHHTHLFIIFCLLLYIAYLELESIQRVQPPPVRRIEFYRKSYFMPKLLQVAQYLPD